MSKIAPFGHGRLALQFCAVGAVAALMAGCSTDSTRLTDPFSNPFATASNEPAPAPMHGRTIPAGRSPPVMSRALSAPTSSVAAAEPLRPRLMTSYNAPVSHETTGSIEPTPVRTASGSSYGGWTSSGGVAVTVGPGESADLLSKRYGVPPTALLQTNGLRTSADVRPGSRITIPVYNAVAAAQRPEPQVARAEPIRNEPARNEPVREARQEPQRVTEPPAPRKMPDRKLAKAELLKPKAERMAAAAERAPAHEAAPAQGRRVVAAAPRIVSERVTIAERVKAAKAEARTADAEKKAEKTARTEKAEPATAKMVPVKTAAIKALPATKAPAAVRTASLETAPSAPAAAKQVDPAPTASVAASAPATDASGNPEFRWPARGRIIQGFKGGSGGNDGINIAVPEGTSVKAAENGTVAYAGSELKGYGNLVLIRHPNGFVTAYANNGELDVKRGDQVKRGQTIAKSGQSGNVASPQLHFELRKGSTPVDPTSYLAGL
ncbi:peptidoglycan DD-metalloendopeptidase family protein [Lichenihabitans psoromatis]|uniref:peptidoglycan DD-metalloendopeptidase family protein n=1 Tax=Lichenihabitans psoromatis TaxID=2528642 RepID=UPI0010384809|nr:peptidoglycan DD-metalloendopeptidase family protein [Lichenihabitans psoromatis]